jgi:hypothetical protein
MSVIYNLDATLHRLREEKGWCTKKEARFVKSLDEKGLIKKGQRPGRREVKDLDKLITEFENRDED